MAASRSRATRPASSAGPASRCPRPAPMRASRASPSTPLTFEVTARNEAGLDSPVTQTTSPVMLDEVPTVNLTKAPRGLVSPGRTWSSPSTDPGCGRDRVRGRRSTEGRAVAAAAERAPRRQPHHPGRSDLHRRGREDGEAPGTWTAPPRAPRGRKLRKLVGRVSRPSSTAAPTRRVRPRRLRGQDQAAGKRGKFKADPVATDPSGKPESASDLKVGAGETVCASVRRSTARQPVGVVEGALRDAALRRAGPAQEGNWKRSAVRGIRATRAAGERSGASLNFLLGRASKVKVLAGRSSACGKLAVEVRGHRRKVIDLSKTENGARGSPCSMPSGRSGRMGGCA